MTSLFRRSARGVVVTFLACFALLAGCASTNSVGGGGSDTDVTRAGIVGDQTEAGEPVSGGTLSFAGYSMPSSLDPTKTPPAGATGGTEMANVYDLLVRYDADQKEFVPQLAKTLTESDDHLTWTLGLRDGVSFSDGTPVDAQAVVASINRYSAENGANSVQFKTGVESVEAKDPQTVIFTLNEPWTEFPAMLSIGYGMIVAPAAYADPDDFTPVGAGPYTVASFVPGDSLELKPREDYWDGKPYLDMLKFVGVAGGSARLEALDAGDIDMAFMRSAEWVAAAKDRYPGYYEPLSVNDALQINSREGHPGQDQNVRKAMALAVDASVINQRAFNGEGHPTTKVFADWSRWHNDVPATEFDPEQAKQLVSRAVANGFDGNLTYVTANDPVSQSIALSVQAMLDSVGFNVDIQYAASSSDMHKRLYIDHDFDIAYSSYSLPDAVPVLRLAAALRSDSSNNLLGYNSPDMDKLLDAAQQATGESDIKNSLQAIEQIIHDDVPFLPLGWGANYVSWTEDVHDAVPSNDGIMLLGKVWLAQ